MADEKIIARFTADISEYKAKLIELEGELNKLSDEQKKTGDEQKKTSAELTTASQKRKAALQNEEAELKRLQAALKQAFTVKDIETFNQKIAQSKANISTLKGEVGGIGKIAGGLGSQFGELGASIAAAFSVTAIIQFAKASVQSFAEAEANANKLKFAVTAIGQEGTKEFERLVRTSERFQGFFSDDDIQRSQTQLIQFGLTTNEVEKLLPKILDLAAATGTDLAQATDLLIQGINGQTRALKPLGLEFKNTGDKAENLAIVTEKLNKFQGASADILNTVTGRATELANKFDNLKESTGEFLVNLGSQFVVAGKIAAEFFKKIFPPSAEQAASTQKEAFVDFTDSIIKQIESAGSNIDAVSKQLVDKQLDNINKVNAGIQSLQLRLDAIREKGNVNAKEEFALVTAIQKETDTNLNNEIQKLNIINDLLSQKTNLGLTDEETAKRRAEEEEKIKKELEKQKKLLEELNAIAANNIQNRDTQIIQFKEDNKKALEDKNKDIRDSLDKQIEDNNDKNRRIAEADRIARDRDVDEFKKAAEEKKKINDQVIQESVQLANQIADAIFETQRNNLRRQQEAETQALEQQKDKALRSKRLTDAERDKLNKEFAAKELALKKKQFEQTKKLSLSEAIIKGALAVVNALASSVPPYNYILAAAVAAATAVEIATISAQKFAKGTKKAKGGMALVGEEGPEFMYVPNHAKILTAKQTRQHSNIIDAIYDNRLEKLIYQDHILPALEKQKSDFNKRKEQSFADNLSRSLIFQGLTGKEMDKIRRKGTAITNTDELAEKIAAIISKGFDRRRMI